MKATGPQFRVDDSRPPYNYQPGERIVLVLEGAVFKGFFIRAIDYTVPAFTAPGDDFPTRTTVGSFAADNPGYKTYKACAAITHLDGSDKNQVTVVWTAPLDQAGQVYFDATVVQGYNTFWKGLTA